MDTESVIAWVLPSVLLLAWGAALAFAVPRLVALVIKPGRALFLAILGLYAALFAIGLWIWAVAMPFGDDARAFINGELEPWFWGTLALVVFILGAFFLLRRGLRFLARKALTTKSPVDDYVVHSIRRPAHVLILFAGFVLWIEIVPAPEGVASRIGMVSEVVGILVGTLFVDGLLAGFFESRRETSRVFATAGSVLRAMSRVVLFVVAAVMILSAIGVAVTPIVASLGVGSLAIGLALQSTLEDFIAGLLIAADQPVTVGDFIELTDHSLAGSVESIGWRTTQILTRERVNVIVPNATLARATIINRSRPSPVLRFQAAVGVHYASDLEHVARVTQEVARELQRSHPFATDDFDPGVVFQEFGDSSINLKVWLEATDWYHHFSVHDTFIRRLHERYNEEGINIPFPIRTLDVPPALIAALARSADQPEKTSSPGNGSP